MNDRPLAGCGVAVTRPAHQAGGLIRTLEQAGARVLAFPTIAIEALELPPPAPADWYLFTSPNAVRTGWPLLQTRARGARLGAVGAGTAGALRALGVSPELVPDGAGGSEALLEVPALADVAGRRIVLVTGTGGRDLLDGELRRRGAEVVRLETYRRTVPGGDPAPLLQAWRSNRLHAVVLTSNTALEHLWGMLDPEGRRQLSRTQLVGVSTRMLKLAEQLGLRRPLVAESAADAALLATLATWWNRHGTAHD